MNVELTEAEWSDVLATLPESPEDAAGWELSLVRRTIERIVAERLAKVLNDAADDLEGRLGTDEAPRTLWQFRQWLRDRAALNGTDA